MPCFFSTSAFIILKIKREGNITLNNEVYNILCKNFINIEDTSTKIEVEVWPLLEKFEGFGVILWLDVARREKISLN